MTTNTKTFSNNAPISMMARPSFGFGGPRFLLDGENTGGDNGAAAAEAAAAAEKAAADKAAAEKKEADDKAAAEAARKNSNMSDDAARLLKEQMATKAKLTDKTKEADEAKAALAAYGGVDPERVKKLIAEADAAEAARKTAEEENLKKAGEFDRLKAMMVESHQKETKDLSDAVTATRSELEGAKKTINDLTVGAAFSNSKFVTEQTVLPTASARKIFGDHFEVENGVPVGYDKPRGEANRTKLVNGSGDPMPFEDAIKKIVESSSEKEQLLRSNLKDGTRATTIDTRPGAAAREQQKSGPTGMQRIQAALASGALKKKT